MKLGISLGGTDLGRSGIGTYVREIAPRLAALLRAEGGALVAMGTDKELAAYAEVLAEAERLRIASMWDRPGASAAFHLAHAGRAAAAAGCDVLLLPAANRRMSFRSPIPVVAVVHDLAQLHVARKYDRARMAYVRNVLLPALASADELVAVSKATRDDVERALGRKAGLRVVGNGVDVRKFVPATPGSEAVFAARDALGLPRPYVLYLSRLELPGKNHLRLVEAFAQSSLRAGHDLVLAGPDWGGREAIVAEAARFGVSDRVRLLGFVPAQHVAALVAGADVAAMVGLFEGFGLPALEALACGVPVVVSTTGALPEVVGPHGLLADPTDVGAIRAGLERAATDAVWRAAVRTGGPAWAAERGWDASAGALLGACRDARRAA